MDAFAGPDCRRCRAFYITYDPRWPYGCHTFAMKTRTLPSAAVLESSGRPCGGFEAREPEGPEPSGPNRREEGWKA